MKVYIKAMSHHKKDALNQITRYSENVEKHIVKCAVYGPEFSSYEHWLDELVNWIYKVSCIGNSNGNKFSESEYQNTLFSYAGRNTIDLEMIVDEFCREVRKLKQYPEFQVTREIVNKVKAAESSIRCEIDNYISRLPKYGRGDKSIIRRILNNEISTVWEETYPYG